MKQIDMYKLAVKLLRKLAVKTNNKGFKNSDGEHVTISDVADNLEHIANWMYPELSTEDIAKVVRCKKCRYYKKYKKKGTLKGAAFYACSKDMQKRDPMFFCKEGEEQ